MRTITITKPSKDMKHLLELAREGDVVLQTSDGAEFMVSPVDDFEHEVAQQRQNKKLMTFLKERFRKARQEQGIPLEDAWQQLGLKSRPGKARKKTEK